MNVQERLSRFFPTGNRGLKAFFLKFLHKLFRLSSEKLNLFATYDILELPHQGNEVPLMNDHVKVGIVIQGPIIPRTTWEICMFYKKIYPQVQIVLSTWAFLSLGSGYVWRSNRHRTVLDDRPDS